MSDCLQCSTLKQTRWKENKAETGLKSQAQAQALQQLVGNKVSNHSGLSGKLRDPNAA
jgi:hypothetical protein